MCTAIVSRSFSRFQSTLPARGATFLSGGCRRLDLFQSTLPARGATRERFWSSRFRCHFNPRSPHGERLTVQAYSMIETGFQSTLPARGATASSRRKRWWRTDFNPRSPHGERPTFLAFIAAVARISIHAPRTGSDERVAEILCISKISIHAPRTGSDSKVTKGVSSR